MSFILLIFSLYIPVSVKKKRLRELFTITANAFNCRIPVLNSTSYYGYLLQYALFTKEQVEKSVHRGSDIQSIKDKLYENAYVMGEKLRKSLSVKTPDKIMKACKILYSALGIKFRGTARGEITMRKCFFSQFYSPDVCRIISSLDEGIISGMMGGGKLTFYQRITEGSESCKAHLTELKFRS
jgi:hypothetical protein